jgi:putative hemolysin
MTLEFTLLENTMKKTLTVLSALLLLGILLSACTPAAAPTGYPAPAVTNTSSSAGIANPASVFCTEHGGKLEIITAADGSQTANCTLPDKTVCEEWAYFRGECGGAGAKVTPAYPAGSDNPAAKQVSQLAVKKLADELKVDAGTIQVVSAEPTTWPDACLGVSAAGEVCASVLTDGYKVVLSVGDKQYTVHSNADGSVIRMEK